ncbi:Methylmalonic aciduria and homocystinuria type D-like protein, mitochondrial [Habropoda laboriosa]|uniref:Methylmalonic aciduria and homocystinuria type D-like protein, mitochondrial n=1 Tax=Habropoda laboriosa TaxID=597456 RepID=A0A0L7RB29_9HYME|nr:Methylmalonic aciduria and homocystinuria type D-like protein, mitochondrial [Habropoda laboriosa]
MFCLKHVRKANTTTLFNFLPKSRYSRRSDKNTNSYKLVRANGQNLDDVDGAVLGINSNWELLTPRGFRFYLPGKIGPGWSDVTTTAQVRTHLVDFCTVNEVSTDIPKEKTARRVNRVVEEREMEIEKLAKYFVLAASDICTKLRNMGYWADFINPFSGQPHLNLQKNNALYKTDERFRCLGFKILHRNNCKVISHDNNVKNFLGSLYTTAPASTEFLKEILRDCEIVNVNEAE